MIAGEKAGGENKYQPLFDFGTNLDPDGTRTGTIKQLLAELNYEHNHIDGMAYDITSLGITLDFISQFAGERYKSIGEDIYLTTLKTIKLLFTTNRDSDGIQLFNLIESVSSSRSANMEYGTATPASQDDEGAPVIRSLIAKLIVEIDESKITTLYNLLPSAEGLIQRIEIGTMSIHSLFRHYQGTDDRITAAINRLNSSILEYPLPKGSSKLSSVHEAVCVHLLGLGFVHFAMGYLDIIEKAKVKDSIQSVKTEFGAICLRLSELGGGDICPNTPILSATNYHLIVAVCLKEFRALVKTATKLGDPNKKFVQNAARARNILVLHAYRTYGETDAKAPTLSLIDIAAAICSVRYQQEAGTKHDPRRFGQESQGIDPQRYLDRVSAENPKAIQGFIAIYMERFKEYRAAFMETRKSNAALRELELGRINRFAKLLSLHDIELISRSMNDFDAYCHQQALELSGALDSV